MDKLNKIKQRLSSFASAKDAEFLQGYFKTDKGGYGAGDVFIGVRVPQTRKVAREFCDTTLSVILKLLKSKIHEHRLLAVIMLVERFKWVDETQQQAIYEAYLAHTRYINNWDIVDVSAPKIIGAWLFTRNRRVLTQLAKSSSLWERRIAVMATLYFINKNQFDDTLKLATILLHDNEDLIHKAVGWMLREIGKRDRCAEELFLKLHYRDMPRTMLRYAIEKFPDVLRKKYLEGRVS